MTKTDELDLNLPVFKGESLPPPTQTMEEWVEWLEWCRTKMTGLEIFDGFALDPRRAPVEVPFILDESPDAPLTSLDNDSTLPHIKV
jgi:hypothetical protein